MRKAPLVAGVLMILITTGCVVIEPYPDEWPKLGEAPKVGCPDLSGTYRDLAEDPKSCTPNARGEIFSLCSLGTALQAYALSSLDFHYRLAQFHDRFTEISKWKNGLLTFRVLGRNGTITKRTIRLDNKHVQCNEKGLVLSEIGSDAFGGTGLVPGKFKATFQLGEDGSLIMKSSGFAGGVMVILPVVMVGQQWLRWVRATPGPVQPQSLR